MTVDPEPRRLTPTERLHEVTREMHDVAMAAMTRQPRAGQPSVEIGETAQGRPYVKSVQTYQLEEEDWQSMCARALSMFTTLRDGLPHYEEPATPKTTVVHVKPKAATS
jgi:hypothetical protein